MELNLEEVQEIVRVFADSELEELRLELGGTRLYLSKQGPAGHARLDPPATSAGPAVRGSDGAGSAVHGASAAPAADKGAATAPGDGVFELRSPLLGVFYRRPSPDKPAFVEVGSVVAADNPVCIVDVMKMFTRIPAGTAGRITEICAEDGQLVEHGQVLMRIDSR